MPDETIYTIKYISEVLGIQEETNGGASKGDAELQ